MAQSTEIKDYLDLLNKRLLIDSATATEIDTSVSALKEKIWGEFQSRLSDVIVFGSYDRETLVTKDPESDVDIMIIFKTKEVQAQTYLKQLVEFGEKHYKRSEIYRDFPTVVIDMKHMKFELVPAYLDSSDKRIPAPRSKEFKWIATNPNEFKRRLQEKSVTTKGAVVSVIKIMKYLNYLNGKPFDSFLEIERLVTNRSSSYSDIRTGYFDAMSGLLSIAKTDEQKQFSKTITEKHRRLKVLEKENISEYIKQEMESFLPLPK